MHPGQEHKWHKWRREIAQGWPWHLLIPISCYQPKFVESPSSWSQVWPIVTLFHYFIMVLSKPEWFEMFVLPHLPTHSPNPPSNGGESPKNRWWISKFRPKSPRKSENLLVNHMMDIVPTHKKAPLITTSMNWLQRQALSKESSINEVLQAGDTIRRLQVPRGEAMFVDFELFFS